MTKKLKILGPYTPEHPGPFCTRDGRAVRVIFTDRVGDWPIVALIKDGDSEDIHLYSSSGRYSTGGDKPNDLMNAEEVPVAREFWLADNNVFETKESADFHVHWMHEVIHVREVLPGDGE